MHPISWCTAGSMECWQTLDSLYCLHNQENRPNGRKMRSLSVSDIIVTHAGGEAHAYYVEPIGYKQVDDLLPWLEQAKNAALRGANDKEMCHG